MIMMKSRTTQNLGKIPAQNLNIAALTVNEIGYENKIREDFLESV